jgi:hypothetical protein
MSLETELVNFVTSRSSFYAPIVTAIAAANQNVAPNPTDAVVLSRLCYGQAPANVGTLPYVVWTGPFQYDPGNYSGGSLAQKKARFWFSVYTNYLDDAVDWLTAIENDISELFVPGYYFTLTTCRITQMILCPNTKMQIASDQIQRTGQEFPTGGATMAYTIGWQIDSP